MAGLTSYASAILEEASPATKFNDSQTVVTPLGASSEVSLFLRHSIALIRLLHYLFGITGVILVWSVRPV